MTQSVLADPLVVSSSVPNGTAATDQWTVEQVTPVGPYTSAYAHTSVNFVRMVRSEWRKLWSLRSTWAVAALTIFLMAGLASLFAFVLNTAFSDPEVTAQLAEMGADQDGTGWQGGANPLSLLSGAMIVTLGYQFAQLTVAILGVMSITNEYTSGMIRATLAASPRRMRVLFSKLLVLAATTIIISAIGLALSWLVTRPILAEHDLTVDFSQWLTVRSFLGVVLYLLAIAIFSLGLGALIRHTAGAIAAVVAILLVLPGIFSIILMTANASWAEAIYRYLPTEAGSQIINHTGGQMMGPGSGLGAGGMTMLEPWPGIAVLAGYALLAFLAALIAIRRRDA